MKNFIVQGRGTRGRTAIAAALAFACVALAPAHAQKPLRIVVPYGPGGTGDVIARLVAQEITQGSGRSVLVENRPGGAGVIGATAAATAAPDGATLLLGYTSELVISPSLVRGVGYSTERDFTPVAFAGSTPLLLIAGNRVPGSSLEEFLAAAKSRPHAYSYATAGHGSPAHIAGALLARVAGVELLNVPYKGGSQAVTDVLAGNVSVYFSGMPPAVPLVKGGKAKAFGVASRTPSPTLPEAPALALSYPELDLAGWFGFLAPAGTPAPIVDGLNAELNAILLSPAVAPRLLDLGVQTRAMTPSEFGDFVSSERDKYADLLETLEIRPE